MIYKSKELILAGPLLRWLEARQYGDFSKIFEDMLSIIPFKVVQSMRGETISYLFYEARIIMKTKVKQKYAN